MSEEQVFVQCTVGGPVKVHVKDGVITRMRPIIFNDESDAPSWTIEARGRTFTPPRWLDIPLRSLKFLLLGFFAWAVWLTMTPVQVQ